ncbi:MAG: chemotaxis protein CheD [Oscillospiraceae bacterium]|nr:chemotaxis protein CheD [Oscillospiraceae bacterium]
MSEKLTVGISDWKICGSPDSLITYALGSCVGICLYDKNLKIAGLAHIMLPDSTAITGGAATRAKFADTAIVDMVEAMKAKGASVSALTAKIAGGAVMFQSASSQFNIGERNVEAVRRKLAELRIPIVSADTGLNYGRTVTFFADNGMLEVNSASKGKSMI